MKKILLLIILLISINWISCKKDNANKPSGNNVSSTYTITYHAEGNYILPNCDYNTSSGMQTYSGTFPFDMSLSAKSGFVAKLKAYSTTPVTGGSSGSGTCYIYVDGVLKIQGTNYAEYTLP